MPTAGGTLVYTDTFAGRTVSGSLGTASDGTAWTTQVSGAGLTLSVGSNEGKATGSAGTAASQATLGTTTLADVEAVIRFGTGDGGADDTCMVLLRWATSSTYYRIGFNTPGSTLDLDIDKIVSGTKTTLASQAGAVSAGTFYWLRVRVQGSSLYARLWADGSSEPGTWTLGPITDSAITAAGKVGLGLYDYNNVTTGSISGVEFDSLTVGNLAAAVDPSPAYWPQPFIISRFP